MLNVNTACAAASAILFFCRLAPGQEIKVGPAVDTGTAYTQLTAAGYSLELPDCKHAVPHIAIKPDAEIGGFVLGFTDHRDQDDDRCMNSDRQRTEIRRIDHNGIVNGTTWSHSWKFKLDAGFKPSPSFTHIHQIKALGGDADAPLWTLDALSEETEKLKVMYVGPSNNGSFPASFPLAPFKGTWVQAVEKITYGTAGKYSIVVKRMSDGATLLSYATNSVNNWRSGANSYGPKWGLYRSLNDKSYLRDETVLFADICRDSGATGCPGGERSVGIASVRRSLLAPRASRLVFEAGVIYVDDGGADKSRRALFDFRGRWMNNPAPTSR